LRVAGLPRVDVWHSWLSLAVPVRAHRIRSTDSELAATFAAAGAQLVEVEADLEVVYRVGELAADAGVVAIMLAAELPRGRFRGARAAARVARASRLRLRAAAERSALRRRGYRETHLVTWEPGVPVSWDRRAQGGAGVFAWFPLRAVVIGRRTFEPSLVEAALGEIGVAADVAAFRVEASGGSTLVFTPAGVLRVALGPAAQKLAGQNLALDLLRTLEPPPEVERLLPWPLRSERVGLGSFVLERILPGTPPIVGVTDVLRDECVDFLVRLFELGRGVHVEDPSTSRTAAESVALFVAPAEANVLGELGRRLDADLRGLERGFAHGDFWLLNLLVDEQGRLSGVVDWEAAGAGRLPLVDLFHFHVHARLGRDAEPGPGLIRELVPWLERGGDRFLEAYCHRVGITADPALLESLALAYWLEWTAYSLETYGVDGRRPGWLADNVSAVVAWLGGRERGDT
jgi:hypothetical protein